MQTTEEPVKGGLPKSHPTGAAGTAGETQGTAARGEGEDGDDEELEAELLASEEEEDEGGEELEASGEEADEDEEEQELSADEEAEDDEEGEIIMEAETLAAEIQPAEQREASALDLLIRQHREVDALFDEIENAGDKAKRTVGRLVETLVAKLELHARIEEKAFYPGVREIDEDLVLESFEEHDLMKFAARKLAKTAPGDDSFEARVSTLKEIVEHHVQEEETELFPRVRSELDDDDLARIGQKMLKIAEGGEAPRAATGTRAAKAAGRRQAQPKAASRKAKSSGGKARAKPAKARAKSSGKGSAKGSRGKAPSRAAAKKGGKAKARRTSSRRAARH